MIDANIFKENCLIRIKTRNGMPSRRKLKVTPEIAEKFLGGRSAFPSMSDAEWASKVNEAVKSLSASGKLINCKELSAITSVLAAIRSRVLSDFCNISGIDDGLYLVKTTLVPKVNEYVATQVANVRVNFIPPLAAVYDAEVTKVLNLWGADVAAQLPGKERLPELFDVKTLVVQFTVPEGLPPELRAAEEKKLRETFEGARAQIVVALWTQFQEFITHVVDRLSDNTDGTKKTFKAATIENLCAFCDSFANRNAFNDVALQNLVTKAKEIIAAVGTNGDTAKIIKESEGVRAEVRTAFTVLKAEVDKGIEAVSVRAFDFSED